MLDIIRNKTQSIGTKIIFGIIILVFIFWGVGNFSSGSRNVVGSANGEDISLSEYVDMVERLLEGNPNFRKMLGEKQTRDDFLMQILQQMQFSLLYSQEAERLGIMVTPQELKVAVMGLPLSQDTQGNFSKDVFLASLKQLKTTEAEFLKNLHLDLVVKKLGTYITSGVGVTEEEARAFYDFQREERTAGYVFFATADYLSKVAVTDEETETYYNAEKGSYRLPARVVVEYLPLTPLSLADGSYAVTEKEIADFYTNNKKNYTEPLQYKLRHIFLLAEPEADAAKLAEIEKQLAEIRNQTLGGANFAKLAEAHSNDPMSASEGGSIGWVSQAMLPKEVLVALAGVKPGGLTEIIKMPSGFTFFLLEEQKEEREKPLAEVKDSIRQDMVKEKVRKDFTSIQTKAENDIAEGKTLADIAAEFGISVKNTGVTPLSSLQDTLGLIHSPVEMIGNIAAGTTLPTSLEIKDGIALLTVKEIMPEEISLLDTLKEDIRSTLADQKARLLARADAEKLLTAIKENDGRLPQNFADKVKIASKVLRKTPTGEPAIRPLGQVPTLVGNLFATLKGVWLPQVYESSQGLVVAQVHDIFSGPEEEWTQYKEQYSLGLLGDKKETAAQMYFQEIIKRAKLQQYPEVLEYVSSQLQNSASQ